MPNRERVVNACGEELHLLYTHDARRELEKGPGKITIGAFPDALHTAEGLENILLWGLEGHRRACAPTLPAWTLERVRALLNHPESPTHYAWAHECDQAFSACIKRPVVEGDKPAGPGAPGGKA